MYKTLYETLRFLPSTCKTLYFRISLAESKGFKYFLFAFEELLDTLRVGVYPLFHLVDIAVCRSLTFRGESSSLFPPMFLADLQLRLASLESKIREVRLTIGIKRIYPRVARV